ncbi:zonular occludens toxin domain-containing protein [Iodobacter sp. CM08]|uniref:zonular occludens toxin domain-containing protein n=1 Tax=Iodobacter sp. CM08 TaxID=3085902 RepID=UPI002982279D|nr:zonular occludens toxin domain-containing protein [Iodobacter sp. CM08]MDW5418878.1 zonular occludens toxin domain-containing protein [Iodobacter sp. CM08]
MINLITGQPGAGKTLRTLHEVKALSEKDNREVYYSGITDLKLPWVEIDPEKWFDCPKGAIIVIDECQRIFRTRSNGSSVPKHVSELETHRHKGIDIYLVTQHPMLIDGNVRRLVGRHLHVMRAWGFQKSSIHEWQGIKENCDKSRANSVLHVWSYPKEVFDYYKSAELHTVKRRLPAKLIWLLIMPITVFAAAYYIYTNVVHKKSLAPDAVVSSASMPAGFVPYSAPVSDKKKTTAQWIEEQTPRIPTLAYTAPVYDKLTEPSSVPAPQACVMSKSKGCLCFTDQATPLYMPTELCENIVKHGVYLAFLNKPNIEKKEEI